MSHKTEAELWLGMAKRNSGDSGLISAGIAQASATLALVEALERANELNRLGLLLHIAGHYEDEAMEQACEALTEEHGQSRRFRRDALITLGIEVAE